MKSIRVHSFGGPETLQLDDIPIPSPSVGEVLVRVEAAGVNYADTHQRKGLFRFTPAMPAPIGIEGAGRVAGVGAGVTQFREGELVAWGDVQGSYAEYAIVPAARLIAVPLGLDARSAAASMMQGMTAHSLLYGACPLKPGDRPLLHRRPGQPRMARWRSTAVGAGRQPQAAHRARAAARASLRRACRDRIAADHGEVAADTMRRLQY